jgi:hypothetical protein
MLRNWHILHLSMTYISETNTTLYPHYHYSTFVKQTQTGLKYIAEKLWQVIHIAAYSDEIHCAGCEELYRF